MSPHKTYFNWSSGKDSALALHYLLRDADFNVAYLLTSVNAHYNRVSMHGVRTELLQRQLEAIGIAHGKIELPEQPSNDEYEELTGLCVSQLREQGFGYAAFGDIFLEDLRKYRETQLATVGIKTVFPLWKRNTKQLIAEFIESGFKAIVVCVNGTLLDKSFAGRIVDRGFINDLPTDIDPCGENGEFHTFCFDAPYYKQPIAYTVGETVCRSYAHGDIENNFWFCDLLPG